MPGCRRWGPSERLLRVLWPAVPREFSRRYVEELFLDGPIDARSATIKNHGQKFTLRLIKQLALKGNVTLMCHCAEDQEQWHRHLLQTIILGERI